EYTFKHALTHEVAYDSLLQERRRALHAQIVEAIEQLYPDRQAEYIERLAHHAVRGELWERAAAYLRQARQKAMARSAHREAMAYFEAALDALDRLPGTREQREEIVDTCFDLRGAVVPLGPLHRAVERLLRAETLAEALGDRRRLGWACAYLIT